MADPFQSYGVGFSIRSNLPVDERYVAESVSKALSSISSSRRYRGLRVFITNEGKEYWWRDGITNNDFIPYATDSVPLPPPVVPDHPLPPPPSPYILPPAKPGQIGGVKPGEGISISEDGTISVIFPPPPVIPAPFSPYILQPATKDQLGGVKPGEGVSISEDGTISVIFPPPPVIPTFPEIPEQTFFVSSSVSSLPTDISNGSEANVVVDNKATKYIYIDGWKEVTNDPVYYTYAINSYVSNVIDRTIEEAKVLDSIPKDKLIEGLCVSLYREKNGSYYVVRYYWLGGKWIKESNLATSETNPPAQQGALPSAGGSENIYIPETLDDLNDDAKSYAPKEGSQANVVEDGKITQYIYLDGKWIKATEALSADDYPIRQFLYIVSALDEVPKDKLIPGVEANILINDNITKYIYNGERWVDQTVVFPDPYELPIATTRVLGGVKQGDGIRIDSDGTINAVQEIPEVPEQTFFVVSSLFELPKAIKEGSEVNIISNHSIEKRVYIDGQWLRRDGNNNRLEKIFTIANESEQTGTVIEHNLDERYVDVAVYTKAGKRIKIDYLCPAVNKVIISFCEVQPLNTEFVIVIRK